MVCNPRLAGDVSAGMDCCADLLLLSTPFSGRAAVQSKGASAYGNELFVVILRGLITTSSLVSCEIGGQVTIDIQPPAPARASLPFSPPTPERTSSYASSRSDRPRAESAAASLGSSSSRQPLTIREGRQ